MIMVVIGKHRELLIELLMYYLANSRYGLKEESFIPMIENIRKQNMTGDWWIKEFIDNTK